LEEHMELINGNVFNFKTENLKLVRFENNDQNTITISMLGGTYGTNQWERF